MTQSNRYYRARLQAIRNNTYIYDVQTQKWLTNGFIPEKLKDDFDIFIKREMRDDDSPLSFVELTTYSTWFDMHPDKVAGKMAGGSSFYFPVVVKGTRQDVEKLHKAAMADAKTPVSPLLEMLIELLETRRNH
jgi:hypothetical protein